jgi:hypothetical protein
VGGIYYGVENNKSVFRGIFDLLMSIKPLWIEEAGAEPLISAEMIDGWVGGVRARVTSETNVFLPPHLFNQLGPSLAKNLLEGSDRLLHTNPAVAIPRWSDSVYGRETSGSHLTEESE